jgi:hypothetical protein
VKIIYKYPINPGWNNYRMPKGAKVLSVQTQDGRPQMWTLCDENCNFNLVSRNFQAAPTGVSFDDTGHEYIGTFQLNDGLLVFHLFEDKR